MIDEEIPGVDNDYSGLNHEETLRRFQDNMTAINTYFDKQRRKVQRRYRIFMTLAFVVFFVAITLSVYLQLSAQ